MDFAFLTGFSDSDLILLIGAGIVFLVMAYMIFKQLVKAFIIGIIAAAVPVVLYLMDFTSELDIGTIIWFGLAGIATYFVYDVINGWMTLIRIITWPFRFALRRGKPKPKEIKPKEGEEDKKDSKEEKKDSKEDGKQDKKEEKDKGKEEQKKEENKE
jgi:hypothetical protein